MTMIHVAMTDLGQSTAPMQRAFHPLRRYWKMFREWQERDAVRGAMDVLSDRELQDIGTTRGEIEFVARSRIADPRRL